VSGLIPLLLLASGFAGLAYELAWVKQLSLIFGVTSSAISTVLAAFMCGLALGSALLGRWADRARRPLALYGAFELGIAASAFCLPYVFAGLDRAYLAMARSMPGATVGFLALRYLLCFLVLLVPTALMGGTLPAVTRAWVRESGRLGEGVGLLYATNTLGGVLGTLGTGFVLLGTVGTQNTIRVAVVLNILAGVTSLWLSQRTSATLPPAEGRPARRQVTAEAHPGGGSALLAASALAGATALSYEVLWTRVLVYFTGQTIYAFSTILASFLTGIALGSLVAARRVDRIRDQVGAFGVLELMIGLSAAFLLLVTGRLHALGQSVSQLLPGSVWWGSFAVSFALLLAPTVMMGAAMPVAIKAYVRGTERLGGRLGMLYAANTVGCVIGSLAAGFWLTEWLGAQRAVLAVASVNVALGVALVLGGKRLRNLKVAVAAMGVAVLACGAWLSWHPRPVALARSDFLRLGQQLLYDREGGEASLAVLANREGSRELNINGSGTAYTDYDDVVVHKMLAHVPMLLAADPQQALVIGFGLGSTAWSVSRYPVKRVDCVELIADERETAKLFLDDNKGVLDEPRFRFIVGDGRNYLLTTKARYDVISINAINPSISPYLYTEEFYELCRERLRGGGVVCAWVPTNMGRFPTLARTFQEVFGHASLWFCNPFHAVLIATPGPLSVDPQALARKMAEPEIARDLGEVQLADPVRLLSALLLTEDELRSYVAGAEVNRDDLPYVEFETTRSHAIGVEQLRAMLAARAQPSDFLTPAASPQDRARLLRYWMEFPSLAEGWTGQMLELHSAALPALQRASAANPEDPRARYLQAMAVAQAWVVEPRQFASSAIRQQAIAVLEAGLRPEGMPAERFVAPVRAVCGVLYAEEGQTGKARQQFEAMHRITPEPPEQAALRTALGEP
jgi:spermidine synthase